MKALFTILILAEIALSQSVNLDFQRPQYDGISTSGLSSIGFASYALQTTRWTAGVEVGYSYFRAAGNSEFTLANTRLFIATPPRQFTAKYSVFIPTASYDNIARAAGLASAFVTRAESFLPNGFSQRFELAGAFEVPFDLTLKFSAGLTPVVSFGKTRILANDFELLTPFTVGIVDTKNNLTLAAYFEGNYLASEPALTTAEAIALQARLEAAYKLGAIKLAGYAVLPVDSQVGDVLQNAVGLKAGFEF